MMETLNFLYRKTRMHSAVYAVVRVCSSVSPSVTLVWCIVS